MVKDKNELVSCIVEGYEKSIVKIILLCIDSLEFGLGSTKITQILRGTQTKFITDYELQNNPSFSLLKQFSKHDIKYILDLMVQTDYLVLKELEDSNYGIYTIGAKGYSLFENDNKLDFSFIDAIFSSDFIELDDAGAVLYEYLRKLRYKIAKENDYAAYIVCGEMPLRVMARDMPETEEEFLKIKGIGNSFIMNYYEDFSKEIKEYKQLNNSCSI